jgi:hypothetical protein
VIPQIGLLDPGVSSLFAAFQQGMRDMKRRRFSKIRRTSTRREGVNCVTDFGNGMPKRSIYPGYSTFKSSNGYSRKTRSLNGALSPLGNRSI